MLRMFVCWLFSLTLVFQKVLAYDGGNCCCINHNVVSCLDNALPTIFENVCALKYKVVSINLGFYSGPCLKSLSKIFPNLNVLTISPNKDACLCFPTNFCDYEVRVFHSTPQPSESTTSTKLSPAEKKSVQNIIRTEILYMVFMVLFVIIFAIAVVVAYHYRFVRVRMPSSTTPLIQHEIRDRNEQDVIQALQTGMSRLPRPTTTTSTTSVTHTPQIPLPIMIY